MNMPVNKYANVCHVTQIQEFRTGATRQNMETVHAKEESKRLRLQLTELRDKLNDLEARVRWPWNVLDKLTLPTNVTYVFHQQYCCHTLSDLRKVMSSLVYRRLIKRLKCAWGPSKIKIHEIDEIQ